jgi:hypothetical protein
MSEIGISRKGHSICSATLRHRPTLTPEIELSLST